MSEAFWADYVFGVCFSAWGKSVLRICTESLVGMDARLSGEDGSYAQIVGALLACREGLVGCVRRDADDLAASQQLPSGTYVCMRAGLSKGPDRLSALATVGVVN